jgi:hypothetical protein
MITTQQLKEVEKQLAVACTTLGQFVQMLFEHEGGLSADSGIVARLINDQLVDLKRQAIDGIAALHDIRTNRNDTCPKCGGEYGQVYHDCGERREFGYGCQACYRCPDCPDESESDRGWNDETAHYRGA